MGSTPGSDQKCGGGCETQRTRAGNDEGRNRRGEGGFERRAEQCPGDEGADRQDEHHGNEHRSDSIREALNSRFSGLGLLHQPAEASEFGVGADPGDLDDQAPAHIEGRADDAVADRHVNGHRLPGHQALINCRRTLDHEAVGCDLLPRSHHEAVADHEGVDGDGYFRTSAHHHRVLRAELEQCPQRCAGISFRARLDVPPREDEHGHDRSDLEIDLVPAGTRRRDELEAHAHARHPGHPEEEGVQRPEESGGHTDTDEGVHGGGAVARVDPGRPMERPGPPDCDGCCKCQGQPLPVVELQSRDHRHQQHGQCEGRRDQKPVAKGIGF